MRVLVSAGGCDPGLPGGRLPRLRPGIAVVLAVIPAEERVYGARLALHREDPEDPVAEGRDERVRAERPLLPLSVGWPPGRSRWPPVVSTPVVSLII